VFSFSSVSVFLICRLYSCIFQRVPTRMALYNPNCADVPLRIYSVTYSSPFWHCSLRSLLLFADNNNDSMYVVHVPALNCFHSVFSARCTLVQSAVLRSHVVCLSVRPSVRPSVTLVDCDHIGWNSSEIISPLVSMGCSLSADSNIMGLLQGEHPEILAQTDPPLLIWTSETFDRKLLPNGYR